MNISDFCFYADKSTNSFFNTYFKIALKTEWEKDGFFDEDICGKYPQIFKILSDLKSFRYDKGIFHSDISLHDLISDLKILGFTEISNNDFKKQKEKEKIKKELEDNKEEEVDTSLKKCEPQECYFAFYIYNFDYFVTLFEKSEWDKNKAYTPFNIDPIDGLIQIKCFGSKIPTMLKLTNKLSETQSLLEELGYTYLQSGDPIETPLDFLDETKDIDGYAFSAAMLDIEENLYKYLDVYDIETPLSTRQRKYVKSFYQITDPTWELLNLSKDEVKEKQSKIIFEKYKISLDDLIEKLISDNIPNKTAEIAQDIYAIAPYNDYNKYTSENKDIAAFINSDCSKKENWYPISVSFSKLGLQYTELKLYCSAINDDEFKGYVIFDSRGNIHHTYMQYEI
jgi:hypothetical protein